MALTAAGPPGAQLTSDYLLAAYLAATGGAALAAGTGTGYVAAALHAVGVVGALWAATRPLPRARTLRFFRIFLPVVLTPLLYTELATLNQLLFPGYFDPVVQGWEEAVFGGQVSVTSAEVFPHLWLSELLHAGYFSYYFIVPAAAVGAFISRGDGGLARLTTTVAVAFFACYLCFAVFPVAGPRYEFPRIGGLLAEGATFGLVHEVLEAGSSRGTAFPSSHIAASGAALLACWRDARRWFPWLLPLVVLLVLGTVFGRFHYAVDAVAGVIIAVAAYAATPWLERANPAGLPAAGKAGRVSRPIGSEAPPKGASRKGAP